MSDNPQNIPPTGVLQPPPAPPSGPPPGLVQTVVVRQRRSPWTGLALGCGVVVLLALGSMFVLPALLLSGGKSTGLGHGGNVAIIDVTGEIHFGSGGGGLFREAGAAEDIIEQVRDAADDNSIKAVVLNLNTPGGTPAASQAIAQEVRQLNVKKPVVAAMGDVAASGGYYVASQARQIVANPATLTGSIGVRMEVMHFYELMKRYGVDAEEITSGPMKDMGSPYRAMRPDERALILSIITDTYNQFVNDVAKGRKAAGLNVAKVKKLADGRVFTGNQALQVGLVDQLGDMHDAVDLAAKLAGIPGKPSLRHMGKATGLEALLSSAARLVPASRFPAGYLPPAGPPSLSGPRSYPDLQWGDR